MKPLFIALLLAGATACHAQTDTISVSIWGMGDLTTGMSPEEVGNLLHQKIALPRNAADKGPDTVFCQYRQVDYMLVFTTRYFNLQKMNVFLAEIFCRSPKLKTLFGVHIGDDKQKVIDTYKSNRLFILPRNPGDSTSPYKGRALCKILYRDEQYSSRPITFYLNNKDKVESIGVNLVPMYY